MKVSTTSEGKRVLMLVENLSFPWDRRMRHLANALQRGGYSVSVICPKGEGQDRARFEIIDGVKVYRYPTRQATSAVGYLWEYPWAFFCTAVLTLLVWMRDGIDIIHSANPPDFFFLLAWPLKWLGKKFVFDEHDVSPELYEAKFRRRDWAYKLLSLLQKASYRTADLVLSTNESYRDIARERGRLPASRLAVVRNAVDLEYFSRKEPRPELKGGFAYLAVYLGVMGSQDGVDRVVRAAHHLVHTHGRKDVLTVLIGKGECWADLQELTRELGMESFVKFTGRIPDVLLLDYLSTGDVCLAPDPPSEMNQKSTMIKILEYMACKCPIVSFDLLESRRSAGQAAHYVAEDDAGLFASAINDLLNDPVRRKRMGNVGLYRSTHLIGWNRSRESLLEAYSRLWKTRPTAQEKEVGDTAGVATMCGIAGIVSLHGEWVHGEHLEQMIATLVHRGPDDHGVLVDGSAGLAHTRLSIIDLAGGHQPMSIGDGKLWITFNGEIFNYLELREELVQKGHRFATRSDTEVVLHMYQEEGEDCVRRFNGQWSFAIWDVDAQKLFLSRDRMGVRPLFYTKTTDAFLFASEIKALLAHTGVSRKLDLQALDQIFTFWTTLPPRTAFKNIQQLPPGHSAVLADGELRTWRYWDLEYASEGSVDESRLTEQLLDLLLDATRIRLRSDVPVGAYLSGGLDSTLITALTRELVGDRLRTFSVSFADAEFDESLYQKEASAFLHTSHSDIRCSYDDVAAIFPEVIRHTEQPTIRTAPAPMFFLANLVRESGFKVVLTGEGADETMGGYDIFKEAKVRRFWARNPRSRLRPLLLKRLYPYMEGIQRQPTAYLKHFFHVSESELSSPFFSHIPRWELTGKLKALFSAEVKSELSGYAALDDLERTLPKGFHNWDSFNQAEYLEATQLLPGYILSSQGDRMAMAHSVEGRYPFLDYRVVEFAAKLPPRLKMKVLDQKYLLKRAARGRVPLSIERRPKQPYRAPDGISFFARRHDYVDDLLSESCVARNGLFDPQMIRALAAKFRAGRANSVKDNMALVGVLSTQLLIEEFCNHSNKGHSLWTPSRTTFVASS